MKKFIDLEKLGICIKRRNCLFKYSTSYKFTGEYWVDGRKIYCKTISIGAVSSADKIIKHNISSFDKLIKLEGFLYNSANEYITLPRPTNATSHGRIEVIVSNENIKIQVGNDNVFAGGYITLYYTKTTE